MSSGRSRIVGDVHGFWNLEEDTKALRFLQPDLVLFTGDFGEEDVELVRSVPHLEFAKAVILGNHDAWHTQQFSGNHRVTNESGRSWVWWDYVTDYHIRCSMKEKRFSKECAEDLMESLDMPVVKIKKCMGDPEALWRIKAINESKNFKFIHFLLTSSYGELERKVVLKAICYGFVRTTEPTLCLVP